MFLKMLMFIFFNVGCLKLRVALFTVAKIQYLKLMEFPAMGGNFLHIYFYLITFFNLFIMSEKTFQTSNRQFGVVLNAELKRHAITATELFKKCHFKAPYFYAIRMV